MTQSKDWQDCFHFRPSSDPDKNTESKMCGMAKRERRYDIQWGVVNSGNALCVGIFRTKREAENYRKYNASAYSVVRVAITPLYKKMEI